MRVSIPLQGNGFVKNPTAQVGDIANVSIPLQGNGFVKDIDLGYINGPLKFPSLCREMGL